MPMVVGSPLIFILGALRFLIVTALHVSIHGTSFSSLHSNLSKLLL